MNFKRKFINEKYAKRSVEKRAMHRTLIISGFAQFTITKAHCIGEFAKAEVINEFVL